MEKTKKRLSALVMAVVLLAALACGGVAAWAGDWPAGGPGDNKLTVSAAPADNTEFLADLDGKVVVDVYQIATAKPNDKYVMYDYTAVGDFSSLEIGNPSQWSAESSKKLAEDAAKLVTADTPKAVSNGAVDGTTKLELTEDGLYLALPHGVGKDFDSDDYGEGILDLLVARGAVRDDGATQYDYLFSPSLVAVPNTESGTTDGSWIRDVAITLKPTQKPCYGNLRINKTVINSGKYAVKPVEFVFHVEYALPDGKHDDYKIVQYSGTDPEPAVLKHIPAGTTVTVTEENLNEAGWGLASENGVTTKIKADTAEEVATVAFTNEYKPTPGRAVENTFELQNTGEGEEDWDWTWIRVTPESARTEPTG